MGVQFYEEDFQRRVLGSSATWMQRLVMGTRLVSTPERANTLLAVIFILTLCLTLWIFFSSGKVQPVTVSQEAVNAALRAHAAPSSGTTGPTDETNLQQEGGLF